VILRQEIELYLNLWKLNLIFITFPFQQIKSLNIIRGNSPRELITAAALHMFPKMYDTIIQDADHPWNQNGGATGYYE
jgi:hypothetical protein